MKDCVFITGLAIDTIIGIYDWEKTQTQRLLFDIELFHDQAAAASGDDIRSTLDYEAISLRVTQFVKDDQSELVETLAEHVATMLLSEFACEHLILTLHKPGAIANASSVGVRIERAR